MTKHEDMAALRGCAEKHYNCAQAVLIPFAEDMGITRERAEALALDFGGGMGCGSVCGAVTGALMALGGLGQSQEVRLELLRRVHSLPQAQREVVYLRVFGGLSFREIGDVLGRTETWARVTFYRGKEKLRDGGACDEK